MLESESPYKWAGLYSCTEDDIVQVSNTHFHSLNEYPDHEKISLGVLHAHWRGILSRSNDPDLKFTVFRAMSGLESVGIGFSGANKLSGNFKDFDGEFKLLRVLKKAQRSKIGTRLLTCLAANLYSYGMRNAFMIVNNTIEETTFVKSVGGQFIDRLDNNLVVYAWDDLLSFLK